MERKNRSSVFSVLSVVGVHPLLFFFFFSVQTLYQDFLSQVFFYLSRGQILRVLIPT